MNRKRITVSIVCICLICIFVFRVYAVNQEINAPIVKLYEKGEIVPFEKDFTNNAEECIEGYSVKVLESEILSIHDFYDKYSLSEEDLDSDMQETYYCIVRAEFANENNTQEGVMGCNLYQYPLVGIDFYSIMETYTFFLLNQDMPSITFSLKENSKKELLLPYPINIKTQADYKELQIQTLKLQITEYPCCKQISIK